MSQHPTQWYLTPPYATRFIQHLDTRLEIEVTPGHEADVLRQIREALDVFEAQSNLKPARAVERGQSHAEASGAPGPATRVVMGASNPGIVPPPVTPPVAQGTSETSQGADSPSTLDALRNAGR